MAGKKQPAALKAGRSGGGGRKKASGVVLVLDFDGTLAPICEDPGEVRMPEYMRRALVQAWKSGVEIVVLSGRPAPFLKKHGLGRFAKLEGNFGNKNCGRGKKLNANAMAEAVLRKLRLTPGVLIERKTGWAVHFRMVKPKARPRVMCDIIRLKKAIGSSAKLIPGRLALEIVPAKMKTKAEAIGALFRKRAGRRLIFVGDDPSDLDAMERLRGRDAFEAWLMDSKEVISGAWPPRLKDRRALERLINSLSKEAMVSR